MNNIFKVSRIILVLLTVAIIINRLSFSIKEFIYPYPREYRDGAVIDIANEFANFKNPWSASETLPHTYTYGFISPFIAAIVHIISGKTLNIIQIFKILNFLYIIAIIVMVGLQIKKYVKGDLLLILLGIGITLIFNSFTLRPEPLAIMINLWALHYIDNNVKKISKNIFKLSIAPILLFYIKQYFALLFFVIFIFIAANTSIKKLILFTFYTLVLFFSSLLVINYLFPFYFPHTVINYLNMFNTHNIEKMITQTYEFVKTNYVLSFILFYILIKFIIIFKKIKINTKKLNKPLLKFDDLLFNNVYFIYILISLLVLTFALGQHTGTHMTYYYQLLPIPLTIYSIYFLKIVLKNKLKELFFLLFISLIIFNYRNYIFPAKIDYKQQNHQWGVYPV